MSLINKLTPEQEANLPVFRDEWFRIGTDCGAADQEMAKATIGKMYGHVDNKQPQFIFCDSPITSALAMLIFQSGVLKKQGGSSLGSSLESTLESTLRSSLGSSLWSTLWSTLGPSLWSSLESTLRSSLGSSLESTLESSLGPSLESTLESSLGSSLESTLESSLGPSLGSSLRSSLELSLWSSLESTLRSSLESTLWSSLWSSLWSTLRSSLRSYLRGQQDAPWIAFYKFCEQLGVKYDAARSEQLNWWADLAKSCMWWWPFKNYCIVSNRPLAVRMDERRLLHSFNKPAVEFRDGWKIYAIHNAIVPSKYIETSADDIDPAEVIKEDNATVRMAVIQKLGFLRFKNKLPHKTVSQTSSADLLEFDLNGLKVRGLHVRWKDKFDKALETIIPVPRTKTQFKTTGDVPDDVDDAEQVRRWTLHLGPEAQLVRET